MIFKFDFNTVVKGLIGKKRNIQSFRTLDSMEIDIQIKNMNKALFFKNKTIEKTYFYCFEEKQFYCYDKLNTDKIIDISDIHDFMQGMKNRRIDDFKVEIFRPECFISLQKLFIFNKTRKIINDMSKFDILSFGDDSIYSFRNLCSFLSKTEKEIGIPKNKSFLSSEELFKRFCTHIFDYKKFMSYNLEEFNDLLSKFFCDIRKENDSSEEHMTIERKIKSLVDYIQNNMLNKNIENKSSLIL